MIRQRSFWGWGFEDERADAARVSALEAVLPTLLGVPAREPRSPPTLSEIELSPPRVAAPTALAHIVKSEPLERLLHCYGKSYRDLVRALDKDFSNAPDLVAFPESESDVISLLDWCSRSRIAAIPYGGGSSVCGGVEASFSGDFTAALSIDLGKLSQVLEIDRSSRSARIQAGALGPRIEGMLRPAGLSLRHYPQSFEFSTLGGWIATRSSGHFATLYTHIDELVQSMRLVTPTGTIETRRLPASGAGPSPDRLFIGSEGIFGIITEAWMRIFERPRFRASFSARFADFMSGARACRRLAQSGLFPANCRLLDPLEAFLNGVGTGDQAVLLVGFESSSHSLEPWLARAAECCRDSGADLPESALVTRDESALSHDQTSGAWRSAFLRAPYLRDELVRRGVFVETFETAVTWQQFETLHARVMAAARAVAHSDGKTLVSCRLTHVYPDGAAPYFTVIAPACRGAELEQWQTMKDAITNAMLESGGTTTHHHAVGRDFRPYYAKERPDGFARALLSAKQCFDPAGVMNPGVLIC